MIKQFRFIQSLFAKRDNATATGLALHLEVNVAKVIYSGPGDQMLLCMFFKNPNRCVEMLHFIFQEVDFSHEYGEYSLNHYELTPDGPKLEKTYYTKIDSPRTWYYLANFKGF